MKNNSNALRWLLVALFSVLGLGLLTGSAFAQEEDAQAQQVGDNDVVVEQETTAKSGDSVAGSQVVGVVGGSPTIQGQNSSSGATATSGDVTVVNDATVNAGPSATTTAAPAPILVPILSSHTTGGGAQAQQIGDNNVVVDQETNVESGDCVAGSTVTGVVGSDAVIQNQNSSTGASCTSGDVVAVNSLTVNSGPSVVILPPEEEPPPEELVADLAVTKECVPGSETNTVDCTITVENTGDAPAEGVAMVHTWADMTHTGGAAPAGWTCGLTGPNESTCTPDDGTMDPGESAVITFSATVDAEGATNTASVSTTSEEATLANNSATVNHTFTEPEPIADLAVTKACVPGTDPNTVDCTITIENVGDAPAEDVELLHTWTGMGNPSGTDATGWSCALTGPGAATCTHDVMDPGETAVFTFTQSVDSADARNQAVVSTTSPEARTDNNVAVVDDHPDPVTP